MGWNGISRTRAPAALTLLRRRQDTSDRAFISVPHPVHLTKTETQKIHYPRAFRKLNGNIDDDTRPSLVFVTFTITHF